MANRIELGDKVTLTSPSTSFRHGTVKAVEGPSRVYVRYFGQDFGTWTTMANLQAYVPPVVDTQAAVDSLRQAIARQLNNLHTPKLAKHREKILAKVARLEARLAELTK